jgi:hypothetical protein
MLCQPTGLNTLEWLVPARQTIQMDGLPFAVNVTGNSLDQVYDVYITELVLDTCVNSALERTTYHTVMDLIITALCHINVMYDVHGNVDTRPCIHMKQQNKCIQLSYPYYVRKLHPQPTTESFGLHFFVGSTRN